MTVCVAALAADSRAIVCIADKSLSYGSYIQWDSDSSKMFRLNPSGAVVLFAGGERDMGEVVARLITIQDQIGTNKANTKRKVEHECLEAINFLVDRNFLAPRQISRAEYVTAISGGQINSYVEDLAREIHKFELDCSMLICGLDSFTPFILDLDCQGIVTDYTTVGFQAIGAGWEKATSRLLFCEHKRQHTIPRVLYDIFDAKANAEMAPSVGYEWDAWIMVHGIPSGEPPSTHIVPRPIKDLIEKAWAKHDRSPFEKHNPVEDIPGPPRDWREQLSRFSYLILTANSPDKEQAEKANTELSEMNDGHTTLLSF